MNEKMDANTLCELVASGKHPKLVDIGYNGEFGALTFELEDGSRRDVDAAELYDEVGG